MDTITILSPQEVDWKAYKALRLEALKSEPQAFGSSYDNHVTYSDDMWKEKLQNFASGKSRWIVFAAINKTLIGMVGAYQTEEKKEKNVATIIAVYVQQKHRGKGVAKMLMGKILEILKAQNITTATLCVNSIQTSAVKLYENFGFVTFAKTKEKLGDGNYYDEFHMTKVL